MNRFITKRNVISLILSLFFAFGFFACVKEYDMNKLAKTKYSPTLAAPLIKSSMSIRDLLIHDKNGNVQADANNFLTLIYRGKLLSLKASDFIAFPDQSYASSTPLLTPSDVIAFNALPIGATYTVAMPAQTITFNTNGTANLDSVVFKAPSLFDINISSQFRHDVVIVMGIPYAKKNGVALTRVVPLKYTGTLPVTSTVNVNIDGYTFDMTSGGTTQNKFDIYIAVILTKSSNPLLVTDKADFNLGFTKPSFQKLFGFINQPLIAPSIDTVDVSIFDNTLPGGGTFTILNPAVRIYLSNSYGVPIDATFKKLEGYNPGYAPYPIKVNLEPKLNPWHFPYPTVAQIGTSVKDSVILTNANTGGTGASGSIGDVLNNKPKHVIYQVDAKANPNGAPIPPNTNFALDSSRVTVNFQLDLPLYGTAKNVSVQDTIPFTFTESDINNIEWFLFRLNITNGFPLEMGTQIYFTDSISITQPYHLLDSLISPYQVIVPAAGVDATGKVNSPALKTTDIKFDQARINKVKNVKNVIISGKLSTTNNGNTNVKFYSDYRFDVRLGAMVKVKTQF